MNNQQEWREKAHELIDRSESFHIFSVVEGYDKAICMLPIKNEQERDLIAEQMKIYLEGIYPNKIQSYHKIDGSEESS